MVNGDLKVEFNATFVLLFCVQCRVTLGCNLSDVDSLLCGIMFKHHAAHFLQLGLFLIDVFVSLWVVSLKSLILSILIYVLLPHPVITHINYNASDYLRKSCSFIKTNLTVEQCGGEPAELLIAFSWTKTDEFEVSFWLYRKIIPMNDLENGRF